MRRSPLLAVPLVALLALLTPGCETADVCEPYCNSFCTNPVDDPSLAQCADGSPPTGEVLTACIVTCIDFMDAAGAQQDHEECTDTFSEDTLATFRDDYEC